MQFEKALKKYWKRLRVYEKFTLIASAAAGLHLLLLVLLHVNKVYRANFQSYFPMFFFLLMLQGIQNWRKKRKPAIACLCGAATVALVYILVFAL